jgi:ABC-type transport system involved in multi-copper enzyme maturation permease subunit
MMRPYLAVIRDAFHEALVSRVLWVLLVAITLVLLALVPLGFSQHAGSYLNDEDILDRQKLIERIVAQGKSDAPSPGRHIWQHLDVEMQQSLEAKPSEGLPRRMRERGFDTEVRAQLSKPDFYDPADWKKTRLPSEARSLEKQGIKTLSPEQLARLNRLALEAAYPDLIEPAPARQIQLKYFIWEPGIPLPLEPEQLYPTINQLLVTVLGILLGAFGVFIAVLVTASMIPNTFEAGSVDLLLSKPISRSGLFLAKFFGGCAFIAINAAYFIVGLWLILGWRLGLWNERLLWAIPLYVFLFAIYYGVSALAGLIWRNPIVSVVLAVVFWLVCFALGSSVGVIEQISLNPRRLLRVLPAGQSLIAANQSQIFEWDDMQHDWREIFTGGNRQEPPFMMMSRLVGPVYDAHADRILAFRAARPGFGQFGTVNRLLVGNREGGWRRTEGVTIPDGASGLFVGKQGEILVTASSGVYRLQGDVAAKQKDINFFGLRVPLPEGRGGLVRVSPELRLRTLVSSSYDRNSGTIALFDGAKLLLLERDAEDKYDQLREVKFSPAITGHVSQAGGQVYLAVGGGEIKQYNSQLEPVGTLETRINSTPIATSASDDGRYLAIVFQNARLWLYDTKEKAPTPLDVAGQGDISAADFGGQKLLVADRLTRVSEYDLAKSTLVMQQQGAQPLIERIYRWALHPLYTIFPKPGELNETVRHVLTIDDAKIAGPRLDDREGITPEKVDIWGPVWSNLAFLAVVLIVACLYVQRRDF